MKKKQLNAKTPKKTKTQRESGLTTDVLNVEGKVVEKMELPKEVFAAKVNENLLAQAVRVYLANQRQGTASSKTRGEVAGSTRKIYRQKGTGRARHGSSKAPIFVGGGIIFGPKPRHFSLKFPQKMKKIALLSALASKFKDKDILVVSGLGNLKTKTTGITRVLKNLKIAMLNGKLTFPILLVITKDQENLVLSCRNIQNLTLSSFNLLYPYLLLANQKVIFTQEAIEELSYLWKTSKS